jgi:hypothetical protein
MIATAILVRAQELGVELIAADSKLRWRSASPLQEDFLSLLREHKQEIFDVLQPVVYAAADWDDGEPILPPIPEGARIIRSPSKVFWTWAGAPSWYCGPLPW